MPRGASGCPGAIEVGDWQVGEPHYLAFLLTFLLPTPLSQSHFQSGATLPPRAMKQPKFSPLPIPMGVRLPLTALQKGGATAVAVVGSTW